MIEIPEKITKGWLNKHPEYIFVFGDNTKRFGKKGGAILRDHPQAYGFITKKYPNYADTSYYKPNEYISIFERELKKLENEILTNSNKIYLISKLGGGLANKYGIFKKVIQPGLERLKKYKNIIIL